MSERFFCPGASAGGVLALPADESRHLARVLRLGPGDVVEVFDGQGFATLARVSVVGRDRTELIAVGESLPDRALPFRLTLAT